MILLFLSHVSQTTEGEEAGGGVIIWCVAGREREGIMKTCVIETGKIHQVQRSYQIG